MSDNNPEGNADQQPAENPDQPPVEQSVQNEVNENKNPANENKEPIDPNENQTTKPDVVESATAEDKEDLQTKKTKSKESKDSKHASKSESGPDGQGEELVGDDEVSLCEAIKPKEEVKKVLDPEMTYDVQELLTLPQIAEESGVPENLVTLFHSFGMDASRRENIRLLEENVICFVSGNYLEILDLSKHSKISLRATSGVGIGAFAVHPTRAFIAVAEKGVLPVVCIYRYPELVLYRILREGTEKAYSACEFNPDGELIATVGSDPDYMLTLWEWRNEQVVLRAKAFSQDIFRVAWSSDLDGVLTTAGISHLRFWKVSNTFTGLKLQGKLGKFGKTELSDIEGFVTLPDGKVLTGCTWGNLIVWEGDLIKVQICRKNKRPCHNGQIMQIVLDEGELLTVGQDGWIRTWDFETIDNAESLEEGALFELEPMNELQVNQHARLMEIVKFQDSEHTFWYAQDSGGAIWKLDLSFSHTSLAPELLEKCHANSIVDCVTSPLTNTAATIGIEGKICIYDLAAKKIIVQRRFPSGGSSLIWAPLQVDPKGKLLVSGHQDGVVRVLGFGENPEADATRKAKEYALIDLGQALKPHTKAVTSMAYDPTGKYFVTGSEDQTIFFFEVQSMQLFPIGFIPVHDKVIRLEWLPQSKTERGEVIVYLEKGCVIKVPCPEPGSSNHDKSFALPNLEPTGSFQLCSIKSQLDHNETAKAKMAAYESAKRLRAEARALRIEREPETESEAAKFEEDEEQMRLAVVQEIESFIPFAPPEPSPLLWASIDPRSEETFWVFTGGFDTGYFYKCTLSEPPISSEQAFEQLMQEKEEKKEKRLEKKKAQDGENDEDSDEDNTEDMDAREKELRRITDVSQITLNYRIKPSEPSEYVRVPKLGKSMITCWTFSKSGTRLLIGLDDGRIRVQLLQNPFDLKSTIGYWFYRFHDDERGRVNKILMTHDERFVLSIAADGTFFVYEIMTEDLQNQEIREYRARIPSSFKLSAPVDDITDPKAYSIEEFTQKSEQDRLLALAEQKKAETRRKVTELRMRFKKLKEQNEKIPERLRLKKTEFDLLPQIRMDLLNDRKAKIELVYRETAWQSEKIRLALQKIEGAFRDSLECDRITVRAIGSPHCVSTVRINKLSEEHKNTKANIYRIQEEIMAKKDHKSKVNSTELNGSDENETESSKSEEDLFRTEMKGARGLRVARKLQQLEEAQKRRAARRAQWSQLMAMKPADDYEDPKDVEAIQSAKENMGDFKLKSSPNYIVPDSMKLDALGARFRLIKSVEEVFKLYQDFNLNVMCLRNKKQIILNELRKLDSQLEQIVETLPPNAIAVRLLIPRQKSDENPEEQFKFSKQKLTSVEMDESEKSSKQTEEKRNTSQNISSNVPSVRQLLFSESDPPELSIQSQPEISTRTLESGVERTVIWLPLYTLASDNYLITLSNLDTEFSFVKSNQLDKTHLAETAMENMLGLKINRPLRPDLYAYHGVTISETSSAEDVETVQDKAIEPPPLDSKISQQSLQHLERTNTTESDTGDKIHSSNKQVSLSVLESEQIIQAEIHSLYLRDEFVILAGRLVRCFDAEVRLLRHARFKLDLLLKRAELHQITLFEEFRLLKEFEKAETVLTEKRQARADERQEVTNKITELNTKIEAKKRELERLSQKENMVHEEFKASLGEGHKFADFLNRVFRKKIKRKKAEAVESGSDESSSSDDDDDSSFDESEGESDEDNVIVDLDSCPPGCPIEDYELTCAIRERRLDIEEEMVEEKKVLELLRKDLEGYAKKQRIVDSALKQAQGELEAFQLEKQRQLNELETVVLLRLDQIFYYSNGTVPADFSSGLVFLRQKLHVLRKRIHTLREEKVQQRNERKEAKARHIMLQKHKKLFQKEIEKLSSVCDREMFDKFGKIDDIERLETVMVNPKLEDLTTKMLILQEGFEKAEAEMEERIRDARDVCIDHLRENTIHLTQILMLFNEHQQLQSDLDEAQARRAAYTDDSTGFVNPKELEEMIQLVKEQSEEINALNREIKALSSRQ